MSDILYGRAIRLEVGIPTQEGQGRVITELRVKFKIEKTSEPAPNKAQIEIYNLNRETRSLIENKNGVILLHAGYGAVSDQVGKITAVTVDPKVELIFAGDLKPPCRVNTIREGGDWITKIESGDGQEAFTNSQLDESFAPGAKATGIFDRIAQSFGVPLGNVEGVGEDQFLNGVSLSGMSRDHMDFITAKTGTEWSIQNGALQVVPLNKATKQPAILLTTETGLVGSPNKTKDGMEFKSLLQPGLAPGRLVQIKSRAVDGIYVVRKVVHTGDSREGEWISECESIRVA